MRFAIFPVELAFMVPLLLQCSTAIAEISHADFHETEDSPAVIFAYWQENHCHSLQEALMFFDNITSTLSYVIDKIQHLQDEGVRFQENMNSRISKLEQRLEGVETVPNATRLGRSIKTRNFGCWLDVNDDGTKPVCASSRVSSWALYPVDDGHYILRHVTSSECSSDKAIGVVPSYSSSYGHYKKLSADDFCRVSSDKSYHWKVYSVPGGYSRFVNRETNLALDSDGSKIYHHDINDGEYQHWIMDE